MAATARSVPPSVLQPADAQASASGEHLSLTFYVSADLESVGLLVRWSNRVWQSQKAYNRALLALARARQRDMHSATLNPHEHGWMYTDELCTLADYDGVNRLNVEIHRARTAFTSYGIPGASDIVQRRRGTGQLRLGTGRVLVVEAFARAEQLGASHRSPAA